MSDIPERIYLGYDGSIFGWGWSSERERDSDVEYIRTDVAAEEREKLVEAAKCALAYLEGADPLLASVPVGMLRAALAHHERKEEKDADS